MKILVTSGGTGGHIYPAISLIKYLENNGEEVLFIGAKNRLEEEISQKEEIPFVGLEFNKKNKIKYIISLFKSLKRVLKIINKYKFDIVIGFGNYISFPVVLAAYIKRIPIILHEQNSVMGKANYYLGFLAKKIGYSLPLLKQPHKHKLVNVGNPRSNECIKSSSKCLNLDYSKKNVLIFMGSLGSSSINKVLKQFIKEKNDEYVYHIVTGKAHYEDFIQSVPIKDNVKLYPYIEDMLSLMKKCDLVITRSGATTISEIITLGLPSILIPSPYVAHNHQYYNANYLLKNGACLMIEEKNLTSKLLQEKINYLLNNSEERIRLRINSLKLAIFNSNEKIYKLIKEIHHE